MRSIKGPEALFALVIVVAAASVASHTPMSYLPSNLETLVAKLFLGSASNGKASIGSRGPIKNRASLATAFRKHMSLRAT